MFNIVPLNSESCGRLSLRSSSEDIHADAELYAADGPDFQNIRPIETQEDGSFYLRPENPDAPTIFFALVRRKGDPLYKKYTWILTSR